MNIKKSIFLLFGFLFLFFSLQLNALAEPFNCTLIFYNNGEETKIEKKYSEIAPLVERIFLDTYDVGLNILMTDKTVNDMKNDGVHLEILLEKPVIFKSQNAHMSYFGYKTYVVKENGHTVSLPVQKIFLTFQNLVLVRGIGSIEVNPKIVNIDQRRIKVVTGSRTGYNSAPGYAFGVDCEYRKLLELFKDIEPPKQELQEDQTPTEQQETKQAG